MRDWPSALKTHLANGGAWAELARITRVDGTVLRLTSWDQDLMTAGSPAETFEAKGAIDRAQLSQSDRMRAEGTDVVGFFESDQITEADMRAGLYDFAQVEVMVCNPDDMSDGLGPAGIFWLGKTELGDGGFSAEIMSLSGFLERQTGKSYAADCDEDLGGPICRVRGIQADRPCPTWAAATAYTVREARAAETGSVVKGTDPSLRVWFKCVQAGTSGGSEPSWNTTPGAQTDEGGSPAGPVWEAYPAYALPLEVTGVTDPFDEFTADLTEDDGHFDFGHVLWLTGDNAGRRMEIATHTANGSPPTSGDLKLKLDMPAPIQTGDTATIFRGCKKDRPACRDDHDNIRNFQGHAVDAPSEEALLTTPDAK